MTPQTCGDKGNESESNMCSNIIKLCSLTGINVTYTMLQGENHEPSHPTTLTVISPSIDLSN